MSLTHLHEKWVEFVTAKIYKDRGTVLTLPSIDTRPIFREFITAGRMALRLDHPGAEVTGGWATLLRPGVQSDWHHHAGTKLILVYYPQDQDGELWIAHEWPIKAEPPEEKITKVQPRAGLAVIYTGNHWHKIMPNPSNKNRISLVLTASP